MDRTTLKHTVTKAFRCRLAISTRTNAPYTPAGAGRTGRRDRTTNQDLGRGKLIGVLSHVGQNEPRAVFA